MEARRVLYICRNQKIVKVRHKVHIKNILYLVEVNSCQ